MARSGVSPRERARGGPSSYVARWIGSQSQAAGLLPARRARASVSRSARRRPTPMDCAGCARRVEERHGPDAGARGDRVDERRALRARQPRAAGLAGRDRRRAEGEGPGPAWPARPTGSTPGCWPSSPAATWCRRSGCPTRAARRARAGPLAAAPGPPPHSLKHRIHAACSPSATPARSRTCSARRGRELLDRLELPRAVARHRAGRAGADRRARPPDRRVRARAARARAPTTATCRC